MPYCSQCGSQNAENAKFCSQCGQRLAEPTAGGSEVSDSTAITNFGLGAVSSSKDTGEERAVLGEADAAAVDALPAGSALLVVQRGPGAGSRYLLDTDTVTAGRHPESDIFLDDITVSRRHAEFRRSDEGYEVHDVGSLNGSYVNRDRIDDAVLQNGDEVRIGKFRLIYFTSDSASR